MLDQGEEVTHVEDAGGHPVRVERVEVLQLLAVRREHDLLARDVGDRQGRATAGVAVELGEHHAVEADAVAERLGGVDRVLTDHGVDDEEDLVGADGVADVRGLPHQLLVDAEAAGGVDDDDVVDLGLGELDGVLGNPDRVADAVARLGGVDRDAGALGDDAQLVDGVGALEVAGDEQRGVALALEPEAELSGERRLARALEAGEHDHGGGGLGEPQPPGLAAEDGDELLVDDLDDLLGGVQRLGDLGAARPLLHVGDEGPDHGQGDVGFQQGDTDLACRGVDVRLGQAALAPEVLEGRAKAVGESIEHGARRSSGSGSGAGQSPSRVSAPRRTPSPRPDTAGRGPSVRGQPRAFSTSRTTSAARSGGRGSPSAPVT